MLNFTYEVFEVEDGTYGEKISFLQKVLEVKTQLQQIVHVYQITFIINKYSTSEVFSN